MSILSAKGIHSCPLLLYTSHQQLMKKQHVMLYSWLLWDSKLSIQTGSLSFQGIFKLGVTLHYITKFHSLSTVLPEKNTGSPVHKCEDYNLVLTPILPVVLRQSVTKKTIRRRSQEPVKTAGLLWGLRLRSVLWISWGRHLITWWTA